MNWTGFWAAVRNFDPSGVGLGVLLVSAPWVVVALGQIERLPKWFSRDVVGLLEAGVYLVTSLVLFLYIYRNFVPNATPPPDKRLNRAFGALVVWVIGLIIFLKSFGG